MTDKGLGRRLGALVLDGLRRTLGLRPLYPGDFTDSPEVAYAPRRDGRPQVAAAVHAAHRSHSARR